MATKNWDIEKQLEVMDNSIQNILRSKYFIEGEDSYEDMINKRFLPIIGKYFSSLKEKLSNESVGEKEGPGGRLSTQDTSLLDRAFNNLVTSLQNKYIIPGGSITFRLGNDTNASFSNCYYTPIESDSMEGIFEASTKLAKIFQFRGGSGIDLSILRPEGTHVNNSAKTSSGPVSFMPKFASDADIIGQNGRRAALMISMCIWHPDIEKFIQSKAYPENVFHVNPLSDGRVPNINTANISVKITADFIAAYKADRPYKLRFPDIDDEHYHTEWKGDLADWENKGYSVKVYRQVDPKELLSLIAHCAHKCGDPGILNWRNTVENSLGFFDEAIIPKGVNPCAEQSLPDYGNCLLSAINLSSFVKHKWEFDRFQSLPVAGNFEAYYDLKGLRDSVAANTLFLNLLIDNNTHPLNKNTEQDSYSRRIGIEFTALADTLAMLGINYDSEEGVRLASFLTFTILDAAMEFSNQLAHLGLIAPAIKDVKKLASYITQPMLLNIYKRIVNNTGTSTKFEALYKNSFLYRYLNYVLGDVNKASEEGISTIDKEDIKKAVLQKLSENEGGDASILKMFSFANTSFNTVGPTGTISIVAGHTTSGIEPLFAISYQRVSTITNGKPIDIVHYPIVKYINENKALCDYIAGKEPSLQDLHFTIREINLMNKFIETGDYKYIQELFYYVNAGSINPYTRITMQRNIQRFVDASVSSTINLDTNTPEDEIQSIYDDVIVDPFIKGITVYRAGSKDGILRETAKTDKETAGKETIGKETASKETTGKEYITSFSSIDGPFNTIYKKKRAIEEAAISFCYTWKGAKIYITITVDSDGNPLEVFTNLPKEAGFVTITQPDGTKIKEFSDTVYREHFNTWHLICRLISLLLRTGCPVSEVMSQLDKATFAPLTDMAALVNRALSTIYKNNLEDSGILEELEEVIDNGSEIKDEIITKGDIRLDICPACGIKSFIYSGGCSYCINDSCNYSKCS